MGMHKALLGFGDGQVTFLGKITQAYDKAGITQTIIVVNNDLHNRLIADQTDLPGNVELVINDFPELGRFHSLKTGMEFVTAGSHVFFQNIDNPFVEPELLRKMMVFKNSTDVVLPQFAGTNGHPVLLSPRVCKDILSVKSEEYRIDYFLKNYQASTVEVNDRRVLVNINTLADYKNEFADGLDKPGISH
jgi:CTP:molybdopterin cytidylyltransferase MocA